MTSWKWVKIWMLTFPIVFILGVFNYIVDPLVINKNKVLKIEKLVKTSRDEKVLATKYLDRIDTIILGSSRTMRINPDVVSQFLPGVVFNFSVNSAYPEDFHAILLYLERNNKILKNIIIGIDFYVFNERLPFDRRLLANKELNFLERKPGVETFVKNYVSVEVLFLSLKTLHNHVFAYEEQKANFNQKIGFFDKENGFLNRNVDNEMLKSGDELYNKITNVTDNYFKFRYSGSKYEVFSKQRIEYLEGVINFAQKYGINVYAFLTPVHCYHLRRINKNVILGKTLIRLKKMLSEKFEYVDFMIENDENCTDKNYYDSVHPNYDLSRLIVKDLFSENPRYGKRIKKQNVSP